jgi:hypothetical protein
MLYQLYANLSETFDDSFPDWFDLVAIAHLAIAEIGLFLIVLRNVKILCSNLRKKRQNG